MKFKSVGLIQALWLILFSYDVLSPIARPPLLYVAWFFLGVAIGMFTNCFEGVGSGLEIDGHGE